MPSDLGARCACALLAQRADTLRTHARPPIGACAARVRTSEVGR
jgi:hypothetical protein